MLLTKNSSLILHVAERSQTWHNFSLVPSLLFGEDSHGLFVTRGKTVTTSRGNGYLPMARISPITGEWHVVMEKNTTAYAITHACGLISVNTKTGKSIRLGVSPKFTPISLQTIEFQQSAMNSSGSICIC